MHVKSKRYAQPYNLNNIGYVFNNSRLFYIFHVYQYAHILDGL